MSSLRRSLTVAVPVERVAGYLTDLATSVRWDPHTVSCERLGDGPLGVGTRYRHTRGYTGYEVALEAEVVELRDSELVAWAAEHPFARGREQFRFRPAAGGGTEVEHEVDIELIGVARIGARMVPAVMRRIADDGTDTLRACLEALA